MTESSSALEYRLGYRADIEGLRAIAILMVVACHAKVSWLSGGFVGVDVFYVLSGYLITGLLVQEVKNTHKLKFANFYARRLRRLLPALLLMLAATCVLGWLLLPFDEHISQVSAASSVALWISNFHFAFTNLDYFSPGAESNLFLHTWSLGVEEQFYLVWPLLIALTMEIRKAAPRTRPMAHLNYALGGVLVLSFGLSIYWTWHAPQLAFYMMPSRAWQFATGALVFLLVSATKVRAGVRPLDTRWPMIAGWSGLTMIVAAALWIDGNVPYPGFWALLPTAGTALVLWSGSCKGGTYGVRTLLAAEPMQAIGRISYSWYLWHWPVLLLGAEVLDISSLWSRLLLVCTSLLIAVFSYRYFETPIRRSQTLLTRPRMVVFAGLVVMLLASSLALRWQEIPRSSVAQNDWARALAARADMPEIYHMDCDEQFRSARVKTCTFGDPRAKHTAIAFGDSVDLQWFPAYQVLFDKPGWRLLVITKSSCPMVDEPIFYQRIGREYTECGKWRADALREIAALTPDVVILGSTFTYDYTQQQWVDGTRRVLDQLAPSTGTVFVMRSTPALPFDAPSCLMPRSWLYAKLVGQRRCTADTSSQRNDNVFHWLQQAAAGLDNVHLVDMTDAVCPDHKCNAERNGTIVFRDTQHLTATFAASLASALAEKMGTCQRRQSMNLHNLSASHDLRTACCAHLFRHDDLRLEEIDT